MLKKLCISAAFSMLSFASTAAPTDRIATIQSILAHIAQERNLVDLDLQQTILVGKKALEHMENRLKDDYLPIKLKVDEVINTIFESEEFDYSINKITDYQTSCIVDHSMRFDDITLDPADYPIDQKINTELAKAFPVLDEQTNQIFNICYVTRANMCGSKVIFAKLKTKKNELCAELVALEAANQTTNP